MKIFGKPTKFRLDGFSIEKIHRVGLGLETGTTAFLVALPPKKNGQGGQEYPNAILSNLNPKSWGSLWRISATLPERSGSVGDFLSSLSNRLNISVLETLTTESHFSHEVYAVVDMAPWFASGEVEGASADLSQDPTAALIDGLHNADDSNSRLSREEALQIADSIVLRPLSRLQSADAQLQGLYSELKARGQNVMSPIDIQINSGKVDIPKGKLGKALQQACLAERPLDTPSRVLLFSDTEEKYIAFYFPDEDKTLLEFSLLHEDSQGMIAQFADLCGKNRANILQSFSRIQAANTLAEWRAILDVTNCQSINNMLKALKRVPGCIRISSLEVYPASSRVASVQISGSPAPFRTTGAVYGATEFAGRGALVQDIVDRVHQEHHLIRSFPNTGKSSILQHVLWILEDREKKTVPVYLAAKGRAGIFWEHIVSGISRELQNRFKDEDIKDAVKKTLEDSVTTFASTGGISMERHRPWGPEMGFATSLTTIHEFCVEMDATVVVLLDEAGDALADTKQGAQNSQSWIDVLVRFPRIRWIVAATTGGKKSRIRTDLLLKFSPIVPGPLSAQESAEYLIRRFLEGDLHIDREAVEFILQISGGWPQHIQALAGATLNQVRRFSGGLDIVVRGDVAKGLDKAIEKLDGQCKVTFRRLKAELPPATISKLFDDGAAVSSDEMVSKRGTVLFRGVPGLLVRVTSRHGVSVAISDLFYRWAVSIGGLRSGRQRRTSDCPPIVDWINEVKSVFKSGNNSRSEE